MAGLEDKDVKERIQRFNKEKSSKAYIQEIHRITEIRDDFVAAISAAWLVSSRDANSLDRSMLMRGLEDISESAVLISLSIENSVRNAVRRELRYMLEMSVKALVVDQQMPTSSFEDRLAFMKRKINASGIDDVKTLTLSLIPKEETEVIGRITSRYYKLCEYVHPSLSQIIERVALSDSGVRMGFDSASELKRMNDEVFEVYALILVMVFQGIGASFCGDIMVGVFDCKPDWVFHCNKYMVAIDEVYDYKDERKNCLEALKQIRSVRLGNVSGGR